jgi:hypothetical protein
MVLVVFLTLAVLVGFGRAPIELLKDFLTVVMPSWLVAHAGEEGVKAFAARKEPTASPTEG